MTTTPPSRRRATTAIGLTPDVVLGVALEVVVDHGLEGLHMREVAERLRCNPTVIYHHIGNREKLRAAIVERAADMVPLPPPLGPEDSWAEALTQLAAGMRDTLLPLRGVAGQLAITASADPDRFKVITYATEVLTAAGHTGAAWAAKLFVRAICSEIALDSGADDFRNAVSLLIGGLGATR
ncbi:TetR/AcrR family transcriptional regulator [Amycolatopsis pithecellobii]|uniref:TetR/AcrR family transcriptional regulator n=1 Tax=Amycolatopsis pithecellobii TaxID=664692 RepID=UPI00140BBAE6|nr:TetR/AcrR family transcriptional regulator [Amycolatopsis pithecellobii]